MIFECPHLAEVGLAGQSGEMSEKDQQKVIMKALLELYRVAAQIEQSKTIEGDLFHRYRSKIKFVMRIFAQTKKGRSDPAPLLCFSC